MPKWAGISVAALLVALGVGYWATSKSSTPKPTAPSSSSTAETSPLPDNEYEPSRPKTAATAEASAPRQRLPGLNPGEAPEDDEPPEPWVLQVESLETTIEDLDTSKIKEIIKTDLTQNGYVASGAIMALAALAPHATPEDRKLASATMAKWLKEETKRGTPDALGNVSLLAEKLPDAGGPEAVKALIEALDSGKHPIFVETNLVIGLGKLGDPSAVPAVLRFAQRLSTMESTDELQSELMVEAREAVDECLTKLGAPRK